MHAGPSRPPPVQRESYADTPQPRFRTTSDHYVPSGYGDEERTQKRPRLDTRLTPVIPQRQYPEQPPSPSPQPRTSTSGRVAHAPPMIYTPVLTHPPAYIGRNPLPPQDERFRQDTNPPREHDRYRPGETRLRQPSGEVDAYSGSGYAHASTSFALHHVLMQRFEALTTVLPDLRVSLASVTALLRFRRNKKRTMHLRSRMPTLMLGMPQRHSKVVGSVVTPRARSTAHRTIQIMDMHKDLRKNMDATSRNRKIRTRRGVALQLTEGIVGDALRRLRMPMDRTTFVTFRSFIIPMEQC